jgi:hypothetical protein
MYSYDYIGIYTWDQNLNDSNSSDFLNQYKKFFNKGLKNSGILKIKKYEYSINRLINPISKQDKKYRHL